MEYTNYVPDDDDSFYEWASIHGPMEMIGRNGKVSVETHLYPTGRDRKMAMLRIEYWQRDKPWIPSKLLQREVVRGPWKEVSDA